MEIKDLDMHCGNCSDYLMDLCDRYTPYQSTKIPLCCMEKFENLDSKKKEDIKEIEKWCKENLQEWSEEE